MTRPVTTRARVFDALKACTDPLGATHSMVMAATNIRSKSVSQAMLSLRERGEIFAIGKNRHSRYFLTAQAAAAAEPKVIEFYRLQKMNYWRVAQAKLTPEQKAARRTRENARRAVLHAARPPKPPKVAKPKPEPKPKKVTPPQKPKFTTPTAFKKPGQIKPVNRDSTARKKWAEQEPIYPAHFKVTVCPGFVGVRFEPPPLFTGELLREWKELTA